VSAGAKVVVPARSHEKAANALKDFKGVEIGYIELSDAVSIDPFADRFLASDRPIRILVNDAGTRSIS
jgi:NAD(P)-dependent dehydrogenase (short-subunit alcohol dehydrogenase family)